MNNCLQPEMRKEGAGMKSHVKTALSSKHPAAGRGHAAGALIDPP